MAYLAILPLHADLLPCTTGDLEGTIAACQMKSLDEPIRLWAVTSAFGNSLLNEALTGRECSCLPYMAKFDVVIESAAFPKAHSHTYNCNHVEVHTHSDSGSLCHFKLYSAVEKFHRLQPSL